MWTLSIFLQGRDQPINLWFFNKAGVDATAQSLYKNLQERSIVLIEDNHDHACLLDTTAVVAVVVSSVEAETKLQEDRMVENHKLQERAGRRVQSGPAIMPAGPFPMRN